MEAEAEDEDSRENDTNESESVDPDWDEIFSLLKALAWAGPGLSQAMFGAWARPEIFLSLSRLKPGPRRGFWAELGLNNTSHQQAHLFCCQPIQHTAIRL